MSEKLPNTLNIIKKLRDLLPTLSETEAEAARYQIEQLKKENPFLSSKIKTPNNILECWEARDTTRVKVLNSRLEKEKNLFEGYKVILQENTTDLLLERVQKCQRIIYFIEREIAHIKRFLAESCLENKTYNTGVILESKTAERGLIKKHSGKAHMSIIGVASKNPLHKNLVIEIYGDDIHIEDIKVDSIKNSKSVIIDFKDIYWLEFNIRTDNDILIGLIYFPVADLLDAEDTETKNFYYTILEDSTLSISFGSSTFELSGIERTTTEIMTKEAYGHLLRKVDEILLYRCGVCGDGEDRNDRSIFYRCDNCKFTCHARCTNLIFFECFESKKRKEIEEEKRDLEIKAQNIKKERLNIIIAGVEIREKPKTTDEIAGRIKRVSSNGIIKECDSSDSSGTSTESSHLEGKSIKRYSVEHTLEKHKMLGVTWCCHCGDRIGLLNAAMECKVCHNTYHIDCRSMLFKSCGITIDLLKGLFTYIPTKKSSKKKKDMISLDEFEFVYLLSPKREGKVYLCNWREKVVALKAIQKKYIVNLNHQELVDRERTCLEIARSSNNPFLVKMEGCFQTATHIFFILEFLEGGDLYFHLNNRELSYNEIRMILAGVALGIEGLHGENIIHRDIRLENILFAKNGYIKLTNMSLCSIGAHNGTAHTLCGSFPTIAPEVMDEHYTKAVDWWGFGVLAYQLMLKETPFAAGSIKQMKSAIKNDPPLNLDKIQEPAKSFIMGLLEKDYENRLGTKSIEEIKNHQYFEGLDWEKMEKQELPVDWKPSASDKLCSNFDPEILVSNPNLSPSDTVDDSYNMYFQNF